MYKITFHFNECISLKKKKKILRNCLNFIYFKPKKDVKKLAENYLFFLQIKLRTPIYIYILYIITYTS